MTENRLDVPAFLRMFERRSAQIMWFLGAGASRSAGIKTAGDMIWDFKQRLYRSQKKLPPSAITDIGEPAVRRKLQAHFDELGGFPPVGSEMEYAAYFEATYHAPQDRRAYLDELIERGKPSYGHLALALLMVEKLCHIVWTTNFDRTLEDAVARILRAIWRSDPLPAADGRKRAAAGKHGAPAPKQHEAAQDDPNYPGHPYQRAGRSVAARDVPVGALYHWRQQGSR